MMIVSFFLDSVSNDEGIHIARGRGAPINDLARSLPITINKFPHMNTSPTELDDEVRSLSVYIHYRKE